ncbi:hypothetical protein [Evtepia gabavorous]|uniref:hypothetical protein n=1 Tax=Evtepia gabavorous TaxID=2211183 RepID=UPI00399A11F3
MERREIEALFDKWCKKLRLNPDWDIRLQLVDDPSWKKTGDFQVDCDARRQSSCSTGPIPSRKT